MKCIQTHSQALDYCEEVAVHSNQVLKSLRPLPKNLLVYNLKTANRHFSGYEIQEAALRLNRTGTLRIPPTENVKPSLTSSPSLFTQAIKSVIKTHGFLRLAKYLLKETF